MTQYGVRHPNASAGKESASAIAARLVQTVPGQASGAAADGGARRVVLAAQGHGRGGLAGKRRCARARRPIRARRAPARTRVAALSGPRRAGDAPGRGVATGGRRRARVARAGRPRAEAIPPMRPWRSRWPTCCANRGATTPRRRRSRAARGRRSDDPVRVARCAQFAMQCQRDEIAQSLCEEALTAGVTDARLLALAGRAALVLGDFERARARLLRGAGSRRQLQRVLSSHCCCRWRSATATRRIPISRCSNACCAIRRCCRRRAARRCWRWARPATTSATRRARCARCAKATPCCAPRAPGRAPTGSAAVERQLAAAPRCRSRAGRRLVQSGLHRRHAAHRHHADRRAPGARRARVQPRRIGVAAAGGARCWRPTRVAWRIAWRTRRACTARTCARTTRPRSGTSTRTR